jgi:hypothetical protein
MDWETLYCPHRHCRGYGKPFSQGYLVKNGTSRGRIGKTNGIFAPVSTGVHPRNRTAWTPQRLGVPLPAPARRLAGCGGQPAPWQMRRLALGLPFLACLLLTEVFSLLLYMCAV